MDALIERIRERQQELQERLVNALRRAAETKAQYDELELLMSFKGLDDETINRLSKLRQSKLAENNVAVNEIQDLQARLRIHEELLNALEAKQDGAQ